jgi:hypothetical protein
MGTLAAPTIIMVVTLLVALVLSFLLSVALVGGFFALIFRLMRHATELADTSPIESPQEIVV